MKNIKDKIYERLSEKFGEESVSDQYPHDWGNLPRVQLTEEDNRVMEFTDEGETKSYVRYRIDIWHDRNTSPATALVDLAIGSPIMATREDGDHPLGLKRTSCADVPDPSGMKHKVMRYEGIIDMENDDAIYFAN